MGGVGWVGTNGWHKRKKTTYLEQQVHHLSVAKVGGLDQGRGAARVGDVHVRLDRAFQQFPHRFQKAPMGGHVQGGDALGVLLVHVRLVLAGQEDKDRLVRARLDGDHERGVAVRVHGARLGVEDVRRGVVDKGVFDERRQVRRVREGRVRRLGLGQKRLDLGPEVHRVHRHGLGVAFLFLLRAVGRGLGPLGRVGAFLLLLQVHN